MPLIDLSLVSETLNRLLRKYIAQPHLWGLSPEEIPPAIAVSGDPPDLLSLQTENYALGMYLYHIQEDAHRKNFPAPSGNNPPVRFQEMALNLHYLLTAHGGQPLAGDPLGSPYFREQRIMGLAIKAFHDYPVLDDQTRIGREEDDPYILPESLRTQDNEFRITLQPGSMEEVNKIWTAASSPLRLSALYQVDVVMLQTEVPVARPTPVLFPRIAAEAFQPLWILGTESDCIFTLPGETRNRKVTHSPALVTVGQHLRILGDDLLGRPTRIFLTHSAWTDPSQVEVGPWMTNGSTPSKIELLVAESVSGRIIAPGWYQVYLQRGKSLSNFSPLAIAPRINRQTDMPPGITPSSRAAGTIMAIHGGPFAGADIQSLALYIGSSPLHLVEEEPAPGAFRVLGPTELQAAIPAHLEPGTYAVRVVVNGISTPPNRWLEVLP
ncbi:MAG: DUF4255 domain-containing protein [Proteobacteria bacterium]|nr:DUF4255 domain-containing protein [Pseudomonadota bacterium]